ncbi:hypothetical protein BJV78DRAFT_111527 [Lactifluus subvellereus]|nr:hypothetical protein BJV78DRAFT_111527 [Lactifluus subvellereus]
MRYVVRDDMLLQIPAAANDRATFLPIPYVTVLSRFKPQRCLRLSMKAQHHTHTTADVDKIIRKHYNSNLQDIPLWLARHDAFHNAGLYMSSACASDDALVRIITPSAFAGALSVYIHRQNATQTSKKSIPPLPCHMDSMVVWTLAKWLLPLFLLSVRHWRTQAGYSSQLSWMSMGPKTLVICCTCDQRSSPTLSTSMSDGLPSQAHTFSWFATWLD